MLLIEKEVSTLVSIKVHLVFEEEALNPDIAETPGVFVNYIVKGTR